VSCIWLFDIVNLRLKLNLFPIACITCIIFSNYWKWRSNFNKLSYNWVRSSYNQVLNTTLSNIFNQIVAVSFSLMAAHEMQIWIYWSESNSWIYFYIHFVVLNNKWKNLPVKQGFSGLGPEDRCSSWGLWCWRQEYTEKTTYFQDIGKLE